MTWLRLFLVLGDLLNRLFEEIRRRKYIREGREQVRRQALDQQVRQIEKARKARQRVKDDNHKDSQNNHPRSVVSSERMRGTDPYQRD